MSDIKQKKGAAAMVVPFPFPVVDLINYTSTLF